MNKRKHRKNFSILAEAYFKQPVFSQKMPLHLNPIKFVKIYRIKLLEICWQLDDETEIRRL